MKKIISFAFMALLGMMVALSCVKKQSQTTNHQSPVTVIVMDTTQALLPDVEVQCGKLVYKTSYDGRVVLTPEQMTGVKKIKISAYGFETQKVAVSNDASPLIVSLVPKEEKSKKSNDDEAKYETLRAYGRPSLRYSKTSADEETAFSEEAELMVEDGAYDYASMPAAEKAGIVTGAGMYVPETVSNNISAGKLTAGEVNDFTKWYFWPTLLDSTHKAFINTWRIEPRVRYTVQVMNTQGYPVVNYPVNLTDKQGNTVFQTVTDNTGKAELWNGLIGPRIDAIEPQKTIIVDEPCGNHQSPVTDNQSDVDVVFVFDATGSMGDELRYMQAEMKDVIARAKDATGGLTIRTGAVVYRDHGDEYITRISRLTEDIKTTQNFIDKQEANGGGDFPEAVPEALMAAINTAGWNSGARARIAFLILDAPCHRDSATLALLHDQILNAAAQGIRIVPVVCSSMDEAGEFLMRSIALATNGTSFFLTDDSGIGNKHLKPTTDSLKVEHLNDMLVRTIVEFSAMPVCDAGEEMMQEADINGDFIPNPFDVQELEADPSIPHGEGVHYLLDISGKLITIIEGDITNYESSISGYHLPLGVYFIKTFMNGRWYTKKILVH